MDPTFSPATGPSLRGKAADSGHAPSTADLSERSLFLSALSELPTINMSHPHAHHGHNHTNGNGSPFVAAPRRTSNASPAAANGATQTLQPPHVGAHSRPASHNRIDRLPSPFRPPVRAVRLRERIGYDFDLGDGESIQRFVQCNEPDPTFDHVEPRHFTTVAPEANELDSLDIGGTKDNVRRRLVQISEYMLIAPVNARTWDELEMFTKVRKSLCRCWRVEGDSAELTISRFPAR